MAQQKRTDLADISIYAMAVKADLAALGAADDIVFKG
jgi:hypothetical protein